MSELMSNEEMALRIQAGEMELMSTLWEQNTGLMCLKAQSLYTRYQDRCNSCGVDFDDIFQLCFLALYDAVQAYDPGSGFKLLSYLKFPLTNHFKALLGLRTSKRDPLDDSTSLNRPMGEENDTELIDLQTDHDSEAPFEAVIDEVFQSQLRNALDTSLDKLPPDRAAAIRMRYFENMTHKDIAAAFDGKCVRNLQLVGLQKLRRDASLIKFHKEILSAMAYRGTGYRAFRENQASSVEMTVIRAEKLKARRLAAWMRGMEFMEGGENK